MNMNFIFIFLLTLTVEAKLVTMEKSKKNYSIEIPDDFEYVPTMFGLENVILAPEDKSLGTASLSLTITELNGVRLNPVELKATEKDYQEGRRRYLSERKLELVEFLAFESKKNDHNLQVHSIGMVFKNKERVTKEKSFFIECPYALIHAKTFFHVGPLKELPKLKKFKYPSSVNEKFETSISSFKCPS